MQELSGFPYVHGGIWIGAALRMCAGSGVNGTLPPEELQLLGITGSRSQIPSCDSRIGASMPCARASRRQSDKVVNDDFAFGVMLTVQAPDILGESTPPRNRHAQE